MKTLCAAERVTEGPYYLRNLESPVLNGWLLRLFLFITRTPLFRLLYPILFKSSGIPQVTQLVLPEEPLVTSVPPATKKEEPHAVPVQGTDAGSCLEMAFKSCPQAPPRGKLGLSPSIADYYQSYSSGATTPTDVVERIIVFLRGHNSHYMWMTSWSEEDIRRQAADSTARWQEGKPRSLLEGVPFAVKDFHDALPYPTSAGTSYMAQCRQVQGEPAYLTTLRDLGAILLGKTNVHEVGLGVTGVNLRTGVCRNPHHDQHMCGGSSSGSGGVVAAGVCPFAIGTDGGGSIRIPSSYCGICGLKPTHGRMDDSPHKVNVDWSVSTYGPMCGNMRDVVIVYSVLAAASLHNSSPAVGPLMLPSQESDGPMETAVKTGRSLKGLKVGVYQQWFDDAEKHVVAACRYALALLVAAGCEVVAITVPELELMRVAHVVTITAEMFHTLRGYYERFLGQMNADVRISLTMASYFTCSDYMVAQQVRRRGRVHFQRIFEKVDLIATPTTPFTAPAISQRALACGETNMPQTGATMRFLQPANLLGLPALTLPVGTDVKTKMPIGFQLIGSPWCEATLLAAGLVVEDALLHGSRGVPAPQVWQATRAPQIMIDPLIAA